MKDRRRKTADISIARNTDESAAILEALNLIDAAKLIKSSDIVVITPNWVQKQKPETGTVVGPESLRTVIRFVKGTNPQRIVVATGSGQMDTAAIMESVGFAEVISSEGVEFIDLNKGPFVRVELEHSTPSATNLNRIYDEMTLLISFAQLKVHEEATMTAGLKNIAMGWPPAEEHGYPKKNLGIHSDLHGFIYAMTKSIPTDLSIISANPAMLGRGPANGAPVHTGLVMCGTDAVAVDTVGARLFGYKPQAVRYLYQCINKGLGEGDTDRMNFKGIPLTEAEKIFTSAVYGTELAVD